MNANELTANILADELENWYPTINLCVYSATMLRQQQAEIEALKVEHENLKRAYLILSGSLSNVTGGGR